MNRAAPQPRHHRVEAAPRAASMLAVLGRLAQVTYVVARVLVTLSSRAARGWLATRRPATIGECLAWACETLGGGCLKFGQVLSTRSDVLPREIVLPLQPLQDAVAPFPMAQVREVVEREMGLSLEMVFLEFDQRPLGSGSIAQVHRAVLRVTGETVVVKVRRPGIDRIVRVDAALLRAAARAVSLVPMFRGIPVVDAIREVADSVVGQTSFQAEAAYHRQFADAFPTGVPMRVPRLLDQYCTDALLVSEYVPGLVRIVDPGLDNRTHREAVTAGLRGLYTMLFESGLVHCDLHPGNILVAPDGHVVVVDFGCAAVTAARDRVALARLFLAIAFNDGRSAARTVLEAARCIPTNLDRVTFENDISALIKRASGARAGDFLVAAFVDSLFRIQQRHGVLASAAFTMSIVALVVYEGIIRDRCADLDFQREAIPFVLRALDTPLSETALSRADRAAASQVGARLAAS